MAFPYKVTVLNFDPSGNFWKQSLPLNDAVLKLMRFVRINPETQCTIELRYAEPQVNSTNAATVPADGTEQPEATPAISAQR
jgi:hypothetical protein